MVIIVGRYNVTLMIVTYFLPTIAMGFAYTTVGLELWYSRGIGEYTDHQIDNIRSKRRVSPYPTLPCALIIDGNWESGPSPTIN